MLITSNSTQNMQKTQKVQKYKKLIFKKNHQKKSADLYKPVLNKIMTIHEQYVKHNFVAPLKQLIFVNGD